MGRSLMQRRSPVQRRGLDRGGDSRAPGKAVWMLRAVPEGRAGPRPALCVAEAMKPQPPG